LKKLIAILAALAATLLSLAFTAPAAQAYPEDSVTVSVNKSTLTSGQVLIVRASADTVCTWTVSFAGGQKEDVGFRTTQRFRAPAVDERTTFPLTVTCTYASPSGAGETAIKMADVTRTVQITVLPPKGQGAPPADTAGLADTGGPNAWLLGGGLLLLAGGAGAVVVSRRRAAAH
jgi:LPXTG-motif cell wall-anchored protein